MTQKDENGPRQPRIIRELETTERIVVEHSGGTKETVKSMRVREEKTTRPPVPGGHA